MVIEFTALPVTPATKEAVQELKYDMRVDSYDAVVENLLVSYHEQDECY